MIRNQVATIGVSVNGTKVSDQQLSPGDTISFGTCEVRFDRWEAGDEAQT